MQDTVSIREILSILKKRLWVIFVVTAIVTGVVAYISYYVIKPVYQVSSVFFVQPSNEILEYTFPSEEELKEQAESGESEQNLQANKQMVTNELINTYKGIANSPTIAETVKHELQLNQSVEELRSQYWISNINSSLLFYFTVEDQDPVVAANIANAATTAFQNEANSLLEHGWKVMKLYNANPDSTSKPIRPDRLLNIKAGAAIGLLMGIVLSIIIEFFQRKRLNTVMKG